MRPLLFSALFVLLLAIRSYGAGIGPVAVVDIKMVFRTHPSVEKVKLELENEKAKSYDKIRKKKKQILELEKEFEAKSRTLSENDFRQSLGRIESKKEELRNFILTENKYLKQHEKDLKKPLLKEIFSIIDSLRKKRGYSIVIHKGDVVAFDSNIDLTYDVIGILRKES